MSLVRLSPSKLSFFNDCPRCFWMQEKKKVSRPRGPFPSLPGGMDRIMKDYADQFRGTLPPEFRGKVPGVLFDDMETLKRWRNWRTGISYANKAMGVQLIGALDDCLVDGTLHFPFDFKTKGAEPREDGRQYYQTQLDCYMLMLQENGYPVGDKGYLAYVWPESMNAIAQQEDRIPVAFGLKVFGIECRPDRVLPLLEAAVMCLNETEAPDPADNCEYCQFVNGSTR